MSNISVRAHFDGTAIQLDEPVVLPQNVPLLVTILSADEESALRQDWTAAGLQALERAYGDDEPTYSEADLLP